MPAVYRRVAAKRDIIDHYIYFFENATEASADRFLSELEVTFDRLAEQSGLGAPLGLRHPRLAGLRKWPVMGFETLLIFYLPRHDGVTIVRVLHAARDWWRLLGLASPE